MPLFARCCNVGLYWTPFLAHEGIRGCGRRGQRGQRPARPRGCGWMDGWMDSRGREEEVTTTTKKRRWRVQKYGKGRPWRDPPKKWEFVAITSPQR